MILWPRHLTGYIFSLLALKINCDDSLTQNDNYSLCVCQNRYTYTFPRFQVMQTANCLWLLSWIPLNINALIWYLHDWMSLRRNRLSPRWAFLPTFQSVLDSELKNVTEQTSGLWRAWYDLEDPLQASMGSLPWGRIAWHMSRRIKWSQQTIYPHRKQSSFAFLPPSYSMIHNVLFSRKAISKLCFAG